MNERMIRQQLADLTSRLFQVEAEMAALRGLLAIPASNDPPVAPKATPKAPSVPKRPKGAKDG